MANRTGDPVTEQTSAAERIEEARQLHETINETLATILELVKQGDIDGASPLPRHVLRLSNALAEVRKQEAEFNDTIQTELDDGDIDFNVLRREIGCRLGRIRRCCKS